MKSISIIIPCRNEEKYIGACLDSLIATDYPKEHLLILVCDGCSNDSTPEIVAEYERKYEYIKLLKNKMQTTPYGLNMGIQYKNSDICIILGAHSTVAQDFISENCKALFSDTRIGCAGGILENSYENHRSKIIGFAMSNPFGVGNAYFRTGEKEGFVDTVAFGSYKQEVFQKIGYFDELLTRNQDDEFNFRLKKAGFEIFLTPKIKSFYVVRSNFKHLFRQYFQYGYWKVFVNKKHKMITSLRQMVPFLFTLFLIFGFLGSLFIQNFVYLYFSILFIYIVLGFIFAKKQSHSFSDCLQIIYTFWILHISYGLGYIEGIFDFYICRKKPKSRAEKLSR